jgi:hypothetical protein
MWGAFFVVVDFVCEAAFVFILIHLVVVLRRHGMRFFSAEPLRSVPRPDRRSLMRAIRRGEPVPAEYRGVARQWARRQLLGRGQVWIPILMIPVFAGGLRGVLIDPGPMGQAGFWLMLAGICLIVVATVAMWRDYRVAVRLLRDSAPPA